MTYHPIDYNKNFGGKIAIVTGGASGIGKAVVEGLAYHGAITHIFDIDERKAREDLEVDDYSNVHFHDVDVRDKSKIKQVVDRISKEQGKPWILVNNAGIEYNDSGNLIDMSLDKSKRIVDTNLWGYVHMLRAVVPLMKKSGGGRIVNISSVQARQSCNPGTIYQVTKSAILGLTKSMSIEYAEHNIRTNAILPGGIRTEGMGNARLDSNSNALDDLIRSTPMGRRGHPEEVAQAVLFLLSESASFINGEEFVVDGGLTSTLLGDHKIPETPVSNDPDKS